MSERSRGMRNLNSKPRIQNSEPTQNSRRASLDNKPTLKEKSTIKPTQTTPTPTRLLLVWGMILLSGLGLGVNLFHLQIVRAPLLQRQARQQQMIYLRPFVPRRPIVDRTGNVLATDEPAFTLYAHPKLFKKSKQTIATQLSAILKQTPEELIKQFNQKPSGIRIVYSLKEDVADQVTELQIDGLELIQHYTRVYPQQDLAADVVGYVDVDHRGQAGVEYSQENLLERTVRTVRLSRAGNGALMPDHVPEGFLHFDELKLQLTLDNRLQRAARFALKQQMQLFRAKRGTVMVMDVRNGSILTLVAEPTYNPNQYYNFNIGLFKNWALTDLYEPGSTFKPINVAIALETGAVQPESTFMDSGQIQVGDRIIKNAEEERYGQLTVAEILQHSSNVGMVQIAQRIKPEVFYGWLERLGLGQTVGIDLPFEVPGQIKSQEKFIGSSVERATTAFGQGFSMTPIQMIQLQAAIANGGKLVTPHLVQGLFDTQGQLYWQPNLPAPRPVFSPSTTQKVLEMMETVVMQGTGRNAQIPGYRIAGKTGTSQKASTAGGYSSSAKITSFVGILPVGSPRYVILAVVDEPQGRVFGSTVAAPIVKSVMEALISIERIPPTQLTSVENPSAGSTVP